MQKHNIYRVQILPWLMIDFRLFYRHKNVTLDFSDSVIKDKPLFIASLLGNGETESSRTVSLWKSSALCFDWVKIQNMTVKIFGHITENIQCEIRTYFDWERYPDYEWINEIAKTMVLKD